MALHLPVGEFGHAVGEMWIDAQKRIGILAVNFIECVNATVLVCIAERGAMITATGIDEA